MIKWHREILPERVFKEEFLGVHSSNEISGVSQHVMPEGYQSKRFSPTPMIDRRKLVHKLL